MKVFVFCEASTAGLVTATILRLLFQVQNAFCSSVCGGCNWLWNSLCVLLNTAMRLIW